MTSRQPIPFGREPGDLHDEVARLRSAAERRYTEMDLLVAALNDHITDLRAERDRLLADLSRTRTELDQLRDEASLLRTAWFLRGHKGPRDSGR
jgi:chromosome segregation ATPase